jgi:hypothetical protein
MKLFTRRTFVGSAIVSAVAALWATLFGGSPDAAGKQCPPGTVKYRGQCIPFTETPTIEATCPPTSNTNRPTNTPSSNTNPVDASCDPTNTPTPTHTPTETETATSTPTSTNTPTNTPTSTNTPTPTHTPTPTETPVPTSTATAEPTQTPTPEPTATKTETAGWVDHGAIEPIASVKYVTCQYNSGNGDWAHSISNLTRFGGRLFLGYGDYSCNVPSQCHLLAWDDAQGVVDYGVVNAVALLTMKDIGGMLAVPHTDLSVGTYPSATFLHEDGTIETLGGGYTPRPWHVYGSAMFNGQRYLSGSSFVTSSTDQQAVWRDDAGKWINPTPEGYIPNSYAGPSGRVYGLVVYNGALYHGGNGGIKKSVDGKTWTQVASGTMIRPEVAEGAVYHTSTDAGYSTGTLLKFDGSRVSVVASGVWNHTVGDDGRLYYLTSDMSIKNSAGTTLAVAPPKSRSIARMNGKWYAGTSDSHLFSK